MKIIPVETKIFKNNVGIAGILHQAQTNIKMIGKLAHQLIVKFCSKILIVCSTLVISGVLLACPNMKKPNNETRKAGIVVHIIFLIWANNSEPAIAEAKLVESDNGDILSPKIAPERIAPATKAGFGPIVVPIPKIAIPTVEIVVKPLPIERPTKEQTINAEGTKKSTLKLLKPNTIKAGMIPALIQTAIKVPINKKMKIGMIAVVIPSVIPS